MSIEIDKQPKKIIITLEQETAHRVYLGMDGWWRRTHDQAVRDERDKFFEACTDAGFDPRSLGSL